MKPRLRGRTRRRVYSNGSLWDHGTSSALPFWTQPLWIPYSGEKGAMWLEDGRCKTQKRNCARNEYVQVQKVYTTMSRNRVSDSVPIVLHIANKQVFTGSKTRGRDMNHWWLSCVSWTVELLIQSRKWKGCYCDSWCISASLKCVSDDDLQHRNELTRQKGWDMWSSSARDGTCVRAIVDRRSHFQFGRANLGILSLTATVCDLLISPYYSTNWQGFT